MPAVSKSIPPSSSSGRPQVRTQIATSGMPSHERDADPGAGRRSAARPCMLHLNTHGNRVHRLERHRCRRVSPAPEAIPRAECRPPNRKESSTMKSYVLVHGRGVMAAGATSRGPILRSEGPGGLHADPDRPRRARAPADPRDRSRHAHHRCREAARVRGSARRDPGGPQLWRHGDHGDRRSRYRPDRPPRLPRRREPHERRVARRRRRAR